MANVFLEHCKHGNLKEICEQFQENTAKQNKALITFNFYQGFRFACEHGHLAVAKLIASKIKKEDQLFAMFSASDEYVFRHACANGHVEIVQWILLHHTRINIHVLDNYAFRKACVHARAHVNNCHMDIVALLLPWMHPSTLLLLFDDDTLSNEMKIFIIHWITQHPNKTTHIKRMFSRLCIGGNITMAQQIYNHLDSNDGDNDVIQTKQWDTIFSRTFYNYKFSTAGEDKKSKYLSVLQWLSSLFPDRYFVRSNADNRSKCFILPFKPRADIPDHLVREKTRCDLCEKVVSDLIGCCGHQYCTSCTVTTLTHPDIIYPYCVHCRLHMDECYSSSYEYDKIRQESLGVKEEIMQNRFHPRNIHKFNGWGIDGFSDDEYD